MAADAPPELRRELESLKDLPTGELAARFEELAGHAPHTKSRRYLERRVAWLAQSAHYGETLSEAARKRARELARLSDLRLAPPVPRGERTLTRRVKSLRQPALPPPGTILTRQCHGKVIRVLVLDDGRVEWDGNTFRSLSAAANAITNTHTSGPAFFGLVKRKSR